MTALRRALAVWAIWGCLSAFAQSAFPSRPVNIVVPFPPGGAADQPTRLFSQALNSVWKPGSVVITRPGAGGAIGATAVANATPDGYNLLATNPSLLILPEADRLFGRTPAFERSQFVPLGLLVADPVVLVVKADAPWKTYQELVAAARAQPEQITYGSSGAYSASHLPIEMLAHAANMKLRHISYSGGGPAILAVLGGHIGVTASSPSAVMAHIKAGTLRPLLTTGAKRVAVLPDVPTAVELGYKDAEFYIWIGVFAPAATPEAVLSTLRADMQKAVTMDNGFNQSMVKLGAVPDYRPAAAFEEFLNKDAERLKATLMRIGKVD